MSDLSITEGYITLPITTDPNVLFQEAVSAIAAAVPGWVPNEGQLDVLLLEQFAQMTAETANVAAQVPLAIFQYFGSLVGITPEAGAYATVTTTWTTVDTAGYSIPANTIVAYQQLGNVLVEFQTTSVVTVPSGVSTVTGVVLQALVLGTAPNGVPISTTLVPVLQLPYVSSVVTTTASSGGANPESTSAYLNRLSNELQLLTPRPILPADFAALAPNVAGVYRAIAINGLNPGRTITGTITLTSGSPTLTDTAGSFTLADVGRSVTGTDIPSSTTITAYTSSTAVTMSNNASASETTGTVVLGDLTNQERCVTVAAVDIDGNALTSSVETALSNYLEAQREVNFLVPVIGPTTTEIDVSFTCIALPGQATNALSTACVAALTSYLSSANWGTQTTVINGTISEGSQSVTNVALPSGNTAPGLAVGQPISGVGILTGTTIAAISGSTITLSQNATASGTVVLTVDLLGTWDSTATTVHYLSLVGVLANVPGVQRVETLTFAIHGNALGTTDVVLPGDAPLTAVGTISPSVIAGT